MDRLMSGRTGRLIAAIALTMASATGLAGQEAEVRAAVDQVFEGMRTANSQMVRDVLASEARFAIIDSRNGPATIRGQTVDGWIEAIGGSEGELGRADLRRRSPGRRDHGVRLGPLHLLPGRRDQPLRDQLHRAAPRRRRVEGHADLRYAETGGVSGPVGVGPGGCALSRMHFRCARILAQHITGGVPCNAARVVL